jgi:hypothetical protein
MRSILYHFNENKTIYSQVNNEQFELFGKSTGAGDNTMKITKYNPNSTNDILRLNSVDDYSSHLNNVQTDLDGLKDLLRNENYCFDPNTLMNVSKKNNFLIFYSLKFIFIISHLCLKHVWWASLKLLFL